MRQPNRVNVFRQKRSLDEVESSGGADFPHSTEVFYFLFFLLPDDFLYLCAKSKGKLHAGIKKQTSSFYSASGLYYLLHPGRKEKKLTDRQSHSFNHKVANRKLLNKSMILFFRTPSKSVIAVECDHELTQADSDKLCWLFGEATPESEDNLKGHFVGPRRRDDYSLEYQCCGNHQNMGLNGITRIEEYFPVKDENADHDPMLQRMYKGLDQNVLRPTASRNRLSTLMTWKHTTKEEGLALVPKKRWTTSRKWRKTWDVR